MSSLYFQNRLTDEELKQRAISRKLDLRGAYFRDSTAIIHSNPFRRLKHKTQVFFAPKNDHICTRIEHVMHVASISATICRALDLDGDLAWAIGLGHDLGHAPFGHTGEEILSALMQKHAIGPKCFYHELYSLRVVDKLANQGEGLNLTYGVRDGIVNHCGEKHEQYIAPSFAAVNLSALTSRSQNPASWEGCVVRMSDKIAYVGRDLEDALQLNLISLEQVPTEVVSILGSNNGKIINALVSDIIENSLKTNQLGFSDRIYQAFLALKDFNIKNIYRNQKLHGYHSNLERILVTLFNYLAEIFDRYGYEKELYNRENNGLALRFADYLTKMQPLYEKWGETPLYGVIDYIAGMSDDFAIDAINQILTPNAFEKLF